MNQFLFRAQHDIIQKSNETEEILYVTKIDIIHVQHSNKSKSLTSNNMKPSAATLRTLHRALMRDPPANVVRTLLKAIPDAVFHRDESTRGMLPIHACAKHGKKSAEGLAMLIKAFPASVNITDDGEPCLWKSVYSKIIHDITFIVSQVN